VCVATMVIRVPSPKGYVNLGDSFVVLAGWMLPPWYGFFAAASVFSLPFADGSADAVVNIFAPCAEQEFSRVLRSDGVLVVVWAGKDHLMGLKQALYNKTKENDGRADLPIVLPLIEERQVRYDITVYGRENLQNLFAMTPYYWRTSPSDSEKLARLEELTTPVDMTVAVYRKP